MSVITWKPSTLHDDPTSTWSIGDASHVGTVDGLSDERHPLQSQGLRPDQEHQHPDQQGHDQSPAGCRAPIHPSPSTTIAAAGDTLGG